MVEREVGALADRAQVTVHERLRELGRDHAVLAERAVVEEKHHHHLALQLLREAREDLVHELLPVLGAAAKVEMVDLHVRDGIMLAVDLHREEGAIVADALLDRVRQLLGTLVVDVEDSHGGHRVEAHVLVTRRA